MTIEEKKNALHCLKVMIEEEVCEECDLYGTTGTDHCEADCVRVAIKALEQEPKWIPVSERYPSVEEQYNDFLVIDDTGRMSVQEFYLTLYDHQPFFSGCLNVVAWMPLPKPYEPQEEKV